MADKKAAEKARAGLLKALDIDETQVSQVDLASRGGVRIFGRDRSVRTIALSPFRREEAS